KLIGRLQTRHGPNRVGPMGLLQPIADLGKLIRKQNVIPEGAHRRLYLTAPFISMFAALSSFALMPLGGLRAVAQLVSYEVAFTLAIIGVVIQSGTLSLQGIVNAQQDYPYIVPQILGFAIFYISALA